MTLTLDPAALGGWPQGGLVFCETGSWENASEDGRPWSYIFCSDELPNFCRLLLKMSIDEHNILLRKTALYLDINPANRNGQATQMDSYPGGLSRIRKLLDPLHQLHSLGAAQVQGPLSGGYKAEIITSICKDCPTAMHIIHTTMVSLHQADEQASKGELLQANVCYKIALNLVRSCCWRYHVQEFAMENGPFQGLTTVENIEIIVVRLQARIAAVYFESGKLRMARIYTERALDPRRPYDHRHNKLYSLDIEPWEGAVYAEVLHVAAKISYTHGDVREATRDLEKAGELVPLNEEQKCRLEVWKNHVDSLDMRRAKQREANEMQSQKRNEKIEGIAKSLLISEKRRLTLPFIGKLLVACNWKNKGDRLLGKGRSDLAASTYETTLSKIDQIPQIRDLNFTTKSGIFEGYPALNAIKTLKFKVQAGVAAAFLMSRKYKDVMGSTNAALTCSHAYCQCTDRYSDNCSNRYWGEEYDWMEDQKLEYLKIHYCKAMALKHMGDTVRAIEHMETALGFDPGDSTVVEQLDLLKQNRKVEEDAVQEMLGCED